jgi:hypothetical protein
MDMAGFGVASEILPEMGLAVRAYAPAARFGGFASFGRSSFDLWVT